LQAIAKENAHPGNKTLRRSLLAGDFREGPNGHPLKNRVNRKMERATRFELATLGLGSQR